LEPDFSLIKSNNIMGYMKNIILRRSVFTPNRRNNDPLLSPHDFDDDNDDLMEEMCAKCSEVISEVPFKG